MNPRVKTVKPNSNYTITLTFTSNEVRVFDVKPYSVKPVLGSVQWQNGQDFCPDMLYMDSVPIADTPEVTLCQTI
jgi:hypothetical protein